MGHARHERGISRLVELPLLVVVAIVLSLVVRANVAQAFYIPSGSMEPQLEVGDRVLVSRTAYRLHDVRRGDIVVFPSPSSIPDDVPFLERAAEDLLEAIAIRKPGDDELIKRVIGLPGETVDATDGYVVIDGRRLVEPYLQEGVVTTMPSGPVTVPAGHVFVMGDNRSSSSDSRVIGTIEIDSIDGRAIARIWPPHRRAFL